MNGITGIITATGQRLVVASGVRAAKMAGPLLPRIIAFAGLIAVSLTGAAKAAEIAPPLVHRVNQTADVYPGPDNLAGGSSVNPDGSVTYTYQNGQHAVILPGYNETPAASYQGW